MALFKKKEEKSPFETIMEAYNSLSDEDKDKVRATLQDVEKAEDEREVDKIEEDKAENIEDKDEKSEEVNEESEEIGEKIDEVEDEEKADEGEKETDEDEKSEDVEEEPKEDDKVDYGKISELIDGLTARMDSYDEKMAELETLKETLENYNKEVEGRFGLTSKFEEGNSMDDREMSYYDYKKKILGGN